MKNIQLVKLDAAMRALVQAESLEDIEKIEAAAHGMEQGIRRFLRACTEYDEQGLIQQNKWAEIRIRAKRKSGNLLANLAIEPGKRTDLTSSTDGRGFTKREEIKNAGLSVPEAYRVEAFADIPEEFFESHIQNTKEQGRELTASSVIRLAHSVRTNETPELPDGVYDVILADPPWTYGN